MQRKWFSKKTLNEMVTYTEIEAVIKLERQEDKRNNDKRVAGSLAPFNNGEERLSSSCK